ncbi:MAG: MarR family winged helix-turn-helix transcriptional regulator [Pseudooceanicola nanhaiensis]
MPQIVRDADDVVQPADLLARVSYRIRLLQIAAYKSFEKVVTDFGTAPRYYGLLKIIEANPGIHQSRLAEAIFLDRSSVVPIVEALRREGWIERRATENDRRIRRLFLLPEGKRKLRLLEQQVDRHETAMTAGLSGTETATLLGLLDRIDANLRSALSTGEHHP